MKNTKDSTKKYLFIVPDGYAENQGELTEEAIQKIFTSYKKLTEVISPQPLPFVDVMECPDNFWLYLHNGIILEGGITEWAKSYLDFSKTDNAKVLCVSCSTAQKYSKKYLETVGEMQTTLVQQLNELSQQLIGMSQFKTKFLDAVSKAGVE